MQRLTVEQILSRTEFDVPAPSFLNGDGGPQTVRCQTIGRRRYMALLSLVPYPPESAGWAPEEWPAKELEWRKALSPEELTGYLEANDELCYRIVSYAALDPVISLAVARHLGDDATMMAAVIVERSGLIPKKDAEQSEEKAADAA